MYGIGRKRQAFAGVFAIADQVIACPQQGISMACDGMQAATLGDHGSVGHAVLTALDGSLPVRRKRLSLGEQTRAFGDMMEAFRLRAGVGKPAFTRDLAHVVVHQTPEGIAVSQMRRARGRYAFEGGGPAQVLTPPASGQVLHIGHLVAEVLAAQAGQIRPVRSS